MQTGYTTQPDLPQEDPPPYTPNYLSTSIVSEPPRSRPLPDVNEETGLLSGPIQQATPYRAIRYRDACGSCIGATFVIAAVAMCVYAFFVFMHWIISPSTTGVENMPAFGTSLGCENAPFLFSSPSKASYAIPIGSQRSFDFSLAGDGVSTLELFSTSGDDVLVEMVLRTDDEANLKGIDLKHGGRLGDTAGFFNLAMPSSLIAGSCMRTDMKVYIPVKLQHLVLNSQSLMHLKFPSKENAPLDGQLEELLIILRSTHDNNVLLPSLGFPARRVTVEQYGGYLAGSIALLDNTHIITRENTITYLTVHSIHASDDWYPRLITEAGHGRTTFTYINKDGRPIDAQHQSLGGDLYLQYGSTWFRGPVEINAWSSTTWNVQSDSSTSHHWVRSRFGSDRLYARTKGWVGLYF